jgi:mono/diheme cytochrome c family protein
MIGITMGSQEGHTVWTLTRMAVRWTAFSFTVVILVCIQPAGIARIARTQEPKQKDVELPQAKEAEYVGMTKCAACHFDQYKEWKTSAHGKAFDILPTKYRQDAECLKCHTTRYDNPSGFKNPSNASLAGVSCEACHGPGSEHAKNALRLVDEGITEAALKQLRTSIQRLAVDQCIKCHISKAHKMHPPFVRDESAIGKSDKATATRSKSFFSLQAHEEQVSP